jgi:hypothetical protein
MCLYPVEESVSSVLHATELDRVSWPTAGPTLPHAAARLLRRARLRARTGASQKLEVLRDELDTFIHGISLSPMSPV